MPGLSLDLNKSAASLRLDLQKAGIASPPPVDVGFDLDVSGSFDDEHRDGLTNDLLERLVPWGMVFDPDQQLDVFTFSNGERHAHHVGPVTPGTVTDFVRREIINKVPGYNGGTDYAPVLRKNLEHFGWLSASAPAKSGGLFGKMFGGGSSGSAPSTATKRKSLIMFITDGDNSDKPETDRILREMQERGDQVYIMFIAVSNQGGNFPFLQKVADAYDNTGLEIIRDVKAWVRQDDEAINRALITDELIAWLNAS